MYVKPDVPSSYAENDIGRTIYTVVMTLKPRIVVEVGTLYGYSAICIAQALRDLGGGTLYCYDIWEKYQYNHTTINKAIKNIGVYGLLDWVKIGVGSLESAFRELSVLPDELRPDLTHVDISNDGDIIKKLWPFKMCGLVIFEGGTEERDNVEWMKKYNKTPIVGSCEYRVIDERFPGLSML